METFTVLGAGPAAYERCLVPVAFRPLAEVLTSVAPPAPRSRVLDVACGTGVVARVAAASGARVVGLDLNPQMLAIARERQPVVEWIPGDGAALPFPDGSFDVVYCQQGVQFMPDPAAAIREARRVLAPGGRLAVAVWRELARAPGFAAFVAALDRHVGTGAGDVLRAPFSMPDAQRLRDLVAAAGFAEPRLRIHVYPLRFASIQALFEEEVAATPLAQPIGALPEEVRRDIVDQLGVELRDYVDDDGVVFPIETHILTARA